jgi:hypothetical protein
MTFLFRQDKTLQIEWWQAFPEIKLLLIFSRIQLIQMKTFG